MKKLPFLVNPPKGSRRAKAKKTTRTRRATSATKRRPAPRRKRPVPAGFSSWRDYMASIRKGRKRRNPTGEGSIMAATRKSSKRRRRTARRSNPANPPKRRRRSTRARRNPPRSISAKNIASFALESGKRAGVVLGGKIVARKVRGLTGQRPGSILAALVEAGVGLAGGLLLSSMVSPSIGADFAVGGLLAPMETIVQQAGIPHVSDSLGDDGFLIGGDTGLGYISGASSPSGDVYDPVAQLGDGGQDTTLGRYVAGAAPQYAA